MKKFKTNKIKQTKQTKSSKKMMPVENTDQRLEKLVPLFTDIIGRLLAAKGMLRYRKDFNTKVKEIMDGSDEKK